MIPAAVMVKLATLGLSTAHAEAVAAMLSDVEAATKVEAGAAIEQRRSADRERKARQRHGKSRDITGQDVTDRDTVSPKKETSPTPPKEKITPSTVSEARASSTETRAGFDAFWSIFPNKVGKRDAEKAFSTAVKRSDLDAILAGVQRYAAKTDDRPWCNPATFLNQDRWADQPAAVQQHQRSTAPPGRSVSDVLGDIKAGRLEVPSILDMIKSKTDEHPGPTIDASFERPDIGSAGRSNQLYAFPSRGRS